MVDDLVDKMERRAVILAKTYGSGGNVWVTVDVKQWARETSSGLYPRPYFLPPFPKPPIFSVGALVFFAPLLVFMNILICLFEEGREPPVLVGVALFWVLYMFIGLILYWRTQDYKAAIWRYDNVIDPYRTSRIKTQFWLEQYSMRLVDTAVYEISHPTSTALVDAIVPPVATQWVQLGPRPEPMSSCTPRQAEFLAKSWMEYLGARGCMVSQATRDGGIDVNSDLFVAEVKHHTDPVSPGVVRQITGVASLEKKIPVVFSLNGYSHAAVEVGMRANALLFVYDFKRATLYGWTPLAKQALSSGMLKV